MQTDNLKVFISYSWDSDEHKQWVIYLVNALRKKGIDAINDSFILQSETVNLNSMMVSQIRNSDYIIIVLTENYAKKADELQGGVGFETMLTLQYVRDNLSKLILIMRHTGDYVKVFPFHLQGVSAIDFSIDGEFDKKLEELEYRIRNVPFYEKEPLGVMRELKPKTVTMPKSESINNKLIPKLKKFADKEKSEFLQDAYKQMLEKFNQLFEQTKKVNEEFDYTYDEISNRKSIYRAYVNGSLRTGIKIWRGSLGGLSEGIYLSYGNIINEDSDHSFNEWIQCEINHDNTLQLRRTMNFYGNRDKDDIDSIVQEIWVDHIKNNIER